MSFSIDISTPQVMTAEAINLAVDTILLSGVKNLKAAFNSLCAYASVNHLHWHLYYLKNHALKLETLPVKHLAGDCYEIEEKDYPAVGYAFQVGCRNYFGLHQKPRGPAGSPPRQSNWWATATR